MSERTRYLVSPRSDFWLLGGGYLLALVPLYWLFTMRAGTPEFLRVAAVVQTIGHAINFPHFLVTYQLLYSDHRSKLLTKPAYGFVGIVAPIAIVALIAAAFVLKSAALFGALSIGMGFFSGLHFYKQSFGAAVVGSIHENVGFGAAQRFALKLNLLSIFGASLFYADGPLKQLPGWAPSIALGVVAVTTAYLAFQLVKPRIQGGLTRAPGARGGVSYAGGWAWMLTVWSNSVFMDLASLFHGVQYFAFVAAFRKGKTKGDLKRTLAYLLIPFPIAAVVLGWAPGNLDALLGARFAELGPIPFTVAFHLFFNLHHYAIDTVIWRASDPDVRRYVFESEQPKSALVGAA
jgi:hypothetical protein